MIDRLIWDLKKGWKVAKSRIPRRPFSLDFHFIYFSEGCLRSLQCVGRFDFLNIFVCVFSVIDATPSEGRESQLREAVEPLRGFVWPDIRHGQPQRDLSNGSTRTNARDHEKNIGTVSQELKRQLHGWKMNMNKEQ